MKKIIIILVGLIGIIFYFMVNQQDPLKDEKGQIRFFAFNTLIDIQVKDHYSKDLNDEITDYITRLEQSYSRYIENSDISKLNQGESIIITNELKEVLDASKKFYDYSDHKFDITMGPIIDLWKIGQEDANVPMVDEIEVAKAYVSFDKLDISRDTLKIETGMSIDLGGILKGYAADGVVSILKSHKVDAAIVNLGGNIYMHGSNQGENWRIGVRNPFGGREDYLGIITVQDQSVVTSGPYEKYFIEDGKRYHHIFDAESGYPVENEIESVTVVSDQSIDGDGLTTTVFTLGVEKGLKLLNELEDIEGIIVTKDKEIFITSQLKNKYEHRDETFTIQ